MPRTTSPWEALPLWPNQFEAIRTCLDYLAAQPTGDALVQMPTGTGKTGVIAVVASTQSKDGLVLVLSPSSALADQLRTDIKMGFWAALKLPKTEADRWAPDSVKELLPSLAEELTTDLRSSSARNVLVGTFQALQQIRREKSKFYGFLKAKCQLVIVDEGHREPAPEWADAIRVLERPTILFTATPYRNDQKLFDIADDRYIYYLSFERALADRLIRPVRIDQQPLPDDRQQFAAQLVKRVDKLKASGDVRQDAKVIVRCASEASVSGLATALKSELAKRTDGVLAIHDQFDGTDGHLKQVPNIREKTETYLIHQFKLMEGIDEPRCAILALYEEFGNDRQLVQQVGRVLRHENPRNSVAKPAVVFACRPKSVLQSWERYIRFDKICADLGKPPIRRSATIVKNLAAIFPRAEYIDRRFRQQVDFQDANLWRELLIRKSCVIFRIKGQFDQSALISDIRFLLGVEDRFIVSDRWHDELNCHYILSIELKQTALLASSTFSEPRLTATVLKRTGDFLFFHDTAGLWIDEVLEGARRLDAMSLRCLFPQNDGTKIKSLAVRNSEIGNYSLLSRTLSASSLADSAPFMGDHSNFMTRVGGVAKLDPNSESRRYVGFTRARVSDSASLLEEDDEAVGTITDFAKWVDVLATDLGKQRPAVGFFGRFAAPTEPPANTTPLSILIDSLEFIGLFARGNKKLTVEDGCCDVTPIQGATGDFKYQFIVVVNGKPAAVEIKFDAMKREYKLRSPELDTYLELPKKQVTLTERLNQKQAFRIIPASPNSVYASGQFYDTSVSMKAGAGTFLLDLLSPVAELSEISDEKGSATTGRKTWTKGSLFAFIDSSMKRKSNGALSPFGRSFSGIVCDDPKPECADFIGMDKSRAEVVFVHAKAGNGDARLGVSKLYEVCGQTVKNLAYLRMGNDDLPGKEKKWDDPWSVDEASGYVVTPRIRCGPGDAITFREQLFDLLRRPTTAREVWLVLGNTLSKATLKKAISSAQPSAALLQSFYLLSSTYSQCKSVGVDFKIFCSK
jgi:superfamily II DNA or RNA helicase